MHRYHLSELVEQALLSSGCDPALIRPLDQHATVQLDLQDAPAILVGSLEERVVIWSDLCEFHPGIMQLRSEALLRELMTGFPHSASGQLVLRESEGQLQVWADIAGECLHDPERMADAINAFFESQLRLLEIVRQ